MASVPILPLELDAVEYVAGGRRLLAGVSARFDAGAPSLVLGPNGAGKSLMLRLAHGLLEPTTGRVRWLGPGAGSGSTHERVVRERQAMVFERPVLLRRSAAANVEYALALRGVGRAERASRAADVLAKTGLTDLAERPARVCSAGEQQRLAVARAWALAPEVLFLDEPTAALDPASTRAVESLIQEIAEAGTKIVMTTHDLSQARRLAGDVLFLHAGALVERAPAEQFFDSPESADARSFLRGELLW